MSEKPDDINEDFADLAEAILRLSEIGEQLKRSPLTQKAQILLIQESIGSKRITRNQVEYVLDALPDLKKYLRD